MTEISRHPARDRRTVASIAILAVALFIGACATPGGTGGVPGETRAQRLAMAGQHDEAARAYIGLAAEASPQERDRLTLLAVEQWLEAGDANRARSAFRGVPQPTSTDLRNIWNTNSAALALYSGDADAALDILEPMSRQPLTERHRLRVDELRADAWIQKGDPARAVELMMHREVWLRDRRSVEQNRERLWQGLLLSHPQQLRSSAEVTLDPEVRGWLQIGSLAASTGQQGIGWINGAVRWRDANPDHPAMTIIDQLALPDELTLDYPRQVALLVPLSGRWASAGHAIQNGFLGAYFSAVAGLDEPQTVRVYDVENEGGASAAYMTAVTDGAEFVIGPLLPNSVTELANDILVPVSVLTLNYLPEDTLAPPGLYQFALAPEDEARSAAARAIADGHDRAVALAPGNDWGKRVLQAFASEFEALGGTLLDYRHYTTGIQDFSNTIEDLMSLSGSVRRYQRLRANIGGPLQFDPRRRQDTEFIFLAADAPSGRLLKSQLKFHYSGDLPVYSTSSINAMDGRSNTDLNGIMFADTPWIIAPQSWIEDLPPLFNEYWPGERRLGRLHAMGYDAYQLIAALFAARGGEMQDLDGATGKLYLGIDGRIHRKLAWAQFQGGEAVALPDIEPAGGPIQDISDEAELILPEAADEETWPGSTREL
ncbi:MAG: ABC transporter substrate-binding protein [Woeseiaceae bacterium]|nr:ABC transporter substrate-binding protein [Woeseiaceae bacterium]NIP21224.1 ABC transporter substrate-binding protein [Woeseiaceae bacterium]